MRVDRELRLWLARRRAGKCDASPLGSSRVCGEPAIACVKIFGIPRGVCALHIQPLELDSEYVAIPFLATFYGVRIGGPE